MKGVETLKMAKGGCASNAYQKCLYIILEVAVRDPFFLKSFTCARARKTLRSRSSTAGVPPDTGPSLSTQARIAGELVSGSSGVPSPVSRFTAKTRRGSREYSTKSSPRQTKGLQFFSRARCSLSPLANCASHGRNERV